MSLNSYSNKLSNYSSQTALHKRYQSPNSGSNHYFLSSTKNNTKQAAVGSVSQSKNSQIFQSQVQSNSSTTTGSKPTQQLASQQATSNLNQPLQQNYTVQQHAGQLYSQQGTESKQHQAQTNFLGNTSSQANQGNNTQPSKNANLHQSQSLSQQHSSSQQPSSSYSNIQQRLKQTKHKSQNAFSSTTGSFASQSPSLPFGTSQGHSSSLSSNTYGVTSSLMMNSNKAVDKQKQMMQQSQQFRHSTNSALRESDYHNKNAPYIPSSARVKTDYSVERKDTSDLLLTSPTYSTASKNIQSNLTSSSNNTNNLYTKTMEAAAASINGATLGQSQLNQGGQSSQNSNNYRMLLKKHKSQQMNEILKTDPNVGDYQTNLTRIGPISLNSIGRNVEWLTKQLINEIIMYEQIQMPTNRDSSNESLDCENIVHFQSYQHRNISLSYYLTLPERPLEPLYNKSLILEPFYSESSVTNSNSSSFNPASLNFQATNNSDKSQNEVSLKDFHFIKCVGMGGFSRVYLVQKKDNGKMYALKLIEKKFILTNKKEVIVQNERNIMTIMQGHPFLLQLDYAFESKSYIAFAMEYCAGGEMFYHLRKIKKMTEDQARFYFIEICLGIDFLHDRHIIYRDIKPENILLDIDGHIRIGDFGLSKPDMDDNEFAYSFCGSPEYMAPEMLLKVGHAYPVDHYTLGALLYELVTGLPPFYSQITEEIYKSILSEELTFPDHVNLSSELKHLLRGLLTKHPLQRLGQNMGTKEILSHPWCRKINLADIIYKKIEPPIKIDVMGFNFDEEEFSKGENEFKAKLMVSYYSTNDFDPIFENFYYESPSVQQAQKLRQEQLLKAKREIQNSNLSNNPSQSAQYPSDQSKNLITHQPSTVQKTDTQISQHNNPVSQQPNLITSQSLLKNQNTSEIKMGQQGNSLINSFQSPASKLLQSQQLNKMNYSINESNLEQTQQSSLVSKQGVSQQQNYTERPSLTQNNFDQKENKNSLKEMTLKMGIPNEDSQTNKKYKEEKQSYLQNNQVQTTNLITSQNGPLSQQISSQNKQLHAQQQQLTLQDQMNSVQSLHGKNSKSLQIKQKILATQNQHQQAQPVSSINNFMNHVKNSVSLSSMQQQQNSKAENNNQILKVQTNNYFLQPGSNQQCNLNSNTNISNLNNVSNNVPLSENNISSNTNFTQIGNNDTSKNGNNTSTSSYLVNQLQSSKKQYMNLSHNNNNLKSGSNMRVKTEERDKTFEDYENIQLYTQPSSSQASSVIKKLSSPHLNARSSFNFSTTSSKSTTSASSNQKKGFPFTSSLQKQSSISTQGQVSTQNSKINLNQGNYNYSNSNQNSSNTQQTYNTPEVCSIPTSVQQSNYNTISQYNCGTQNSQNQNSNQNYFLQQNGISNISSNQQNNQQTNNANNSVGNQIYNSNSSNLASNQGQLNSNSNCNSNPVHSILGNYGGFFSSRNSMINKQTQNQKSCQNSQFSQRNMFTSKGQIQSSQKINQSINNNPSKIYNPLGLF